MKHANPNIHLRNHSRAEERGGEEVFELPSPESVFMMWLLSRRQETDLEIAAQQELQRLQAYRGDHPGPRRLAVLFLELLEQIQAKDRISLS